MPDHVEYVIAAYGAWVVTFSVYGLWLLRRGSSIRRALRNLSRKAPANMGGTP